DNSRQTQTETRRAVRQGSAGCPYRMLRCLSKMQAAGNPPDPSRKCAKHLKSAFLDLGQVSIPLKRRSTQIQRHLLHGMRLDRPETTTADSRSGAHPFLNPIAS